MLDVKYNDSQLAAINWNEGAALVLAGPGAGKTMVLTQRIARLIESSINQSYRILALTFTRAAAKEMGKRLQSILGENMSRVRAETFHAFALDLLVKFGNAIGLSPDFIIPETEVDCDDILRAVVSEAYASGMSYEEVRRGIDAILRNGLSMDEVEECIQRDTEVSGRLAIIKDLFLEYKGRLIKSNIIDYSMMLYLAIELLNKFPRIVERVRLVYRYICVDEFQDTTAVQYKMLKQICPKGANVFVVADDDQTIFQWNGASPDRLKEYSQEYEAEILQLPRNYRCPSVVVDMANLLIAHNSDRYPGKDKGYSKKEEQDVVEYKVYESWKAELVGLANDIRSRISINNRKNCLVIARNNRMLLEACDSLGSQGILAEIVSSQRDFSSLQISWLYHFLRFLRFPQSKSEVEEVCKITGALSEDSSLLSHLLDKYQLQGGSIADIFVCEMESLPYWNGMAQICNKYRYSIEIDFKKFGKEVVEWFDAKRVGEAQDYDDFEADKTTWNELVKAFDSERKSGLSSFLQDLSMTSKVPRCTADCVRMQTVHTSKGTEADFVYVIGLADEIFPSYYSISLKPDGTESSVLQEERRNLFVAITRTVKRLYLSRSRFYNRYMKKPSRFLKEMGLEK